MGGAGRSAAVGARRRRGASGVGGVMETASGGGGFPRALPLLLLVLPVLPVLPRAAAEQGERIPGTARRVERFASGAVPLCGFPFPSRCSPRGSAVSSLKGTGWGRREGAGYRWIRRAGGAGWDGRHGRCGAQCGHGTDRRDAVCYQRTTPETENVGRCPVLPKETGCSVRKE